MCDGRAKHTVKSNNYKNGFIQSNLETLLSLYSTLIRVVLANIFMSKMRPYYRYQVLALRLNIESVTHLACLYLESNWFILCKHDTSS